MNTVFFYLYFIPDLKYGSRKKSFSEINTWRNMSENDAIPLFDGIVKHALRQTCLISMVWRVTPQTVLSALN